jgi:hypothetical protein
MTIGTLVNGGGASLPTVSHDVESAVSHEVDSAGVPDRSMVLRVVGVRPQHMPGQSVQQTT